MTNNQIRPHVFHAFDVGRYLKKSFSKAENLYRKAINGGDSKSLYNYGQMLLGLGKTIAQKIAGVHILKKAGRKGFTYALNDVGIAYEVGIGVKKIYELHCIITVKPPPAVMFWLGKIFDE